MYKIKQEMKQGIVEEWNKRQLPSVSRLTFNLKPMQKAIIVCNQENDVLVNLPTGYGKSMLYQYQALLSHTKTIVVIVPLKALLWDSIVEASRLGISAAELSPENMDRFDLAMPPKLLFVTPERLYQNYTAYQTVATLAQSNKIGLFVIDEAHCVCEWGNDFRKDYAKLSSLRQDFPNVKILAMTATAPPQIRNEISQKLRFRGCYFFFASYNRPNLLYEVIKTTKKELKQKIDGLIKKDFSGQSGIIYCQTIKLCQELHSQLKGSVKCEMFHSKVSLKKRERILNQFKSSPGKIIIATICFGMGINKPDVRFVIHAGISFSIENYYQESGRGGRDGKPARCILMSYPEQESTLMFMLERTKKQYKTKPSIFNNRKVQLDSMLRYATNRGECRKKYMFRIMGEDFPSCTHSCDICLQGGRIQQYDFTEQGSKILNCLRQSSAVLTFVQLRNILKGKSMKKRKRYEPLKQIVGLLKNMKEEEIMEILDEMVNENYFTTIIKRNKFATIKRIVVNRRKSYNKITLSKPVKVEVKKKDMMADYIKKQQLIGELKKEIAQGGEQVKPGVGGKKGSVREGLISQYSTQFDDTPYEDDLCQGVILSSNLYQNQFNMPQEYVDTVSNNENDLSFQEQEGEEGEEGEVPEIDQYDIQNLLPQIDLSLSEVGDTFTEEGLYSKPLPKAKQIRYQEKINGVWYDVKKQEREDRDKGREEELVNNEDAKNSQIVQSIMEKYGIKQKSSFKRETQLPQKTDIQQEMNRILPVKKKYNFI